MTPPCRGHMWSPVLIAAISEGALSQVVRSNWSQGGTARCFGGELHSAASMFKKTKYAIPRNDLEMDHIPKIYITGFLHAHLSWKRKRSRAGGDLVRQTRLAGKTKEMRDRAKVAG